MKTAVIAGASGGMGRAVAIELAKKGYKLILHGRDEQKTADTVRQIKSANSNADVWSFTADLSSVAGMKKAVAAIQQKTDVIDVLVLATGIIMPRRVETADGLETNFVAQYLCRFALVQGLMPQLQKSQGGRIVHLGSPVLKKGRINFDDLSLKDNFTMFGSMGQCMLSMHLFVQEFARRHPDNKTVMNVLHVGIASTGVARENNWLIRTLISLFGKSPAAATGNSIFLATDDTATFSGYFLDKPGKPQKKIKLAYDAALAERLWNKSLELIA